MRRIRAVVQATALLMLVCALLAPKVSLAVVSVFGTANTSVLICSDGALKRVTIAADGEIVTDSTQESAWVGPHCALPDARTSDFVRAWQHMGYPKWTVMATGRPVDGPGPPVLAQLGILSRGPPAR